MKPLIILDLDKTIFNTELFWQDTVGSLNNITKQIYQPDDLANKYSSYYKDGSHYLDFNKLLIDNNTKVDMVIKNIISFNYKKDYILPDARFLLRFLDDNKYDVQILTIGDTLHQKLKYLFCPELNKYKLNIISYAKHKFINNNYSNDFGVLIDDKPNQMLRENWHEVYINRQPNANNNLINVNNTSEIDNLRKVPIILKTIYSVTK